MFSPRTLAIWLCAIVVAVVAGPFGTLEAMSLGERGLFWGAVVSLSAVVGFGVRRLSLFIVGNSRPLLADFVAVVVMTAVFAPIVWVISGLFAPQGLPPVSMLPKMFFYVFVVTTAAVVVQRILERAEAGPTQVMQVFNDPAELVVRPRLMQRLPETARHRILRLSGRDHRVVVTTQEGATTLRLRLRDAIAEMEPVEGYSTHRSHWVAQDAVVCAERESPQKLFIILSNGDRVPVSRTYRPALEEAGLIRPCLNRPSPVAASAQHGQPDPSAPLPPHDA